MKSKNAHTPAGATRAKGKPTGSKGAAENGRSAKGANASAKRSARPKQPHAKPAGAKPARSTKADHPQSSRSLATRQKPTATQPVRAGGVQPAAATSPCPHASACGACQHIGMPYSQQLAGKDAYIERLFSELGNIMCGGALQPIRGMADPFHYRNKVVSPFAPGRKGAILTGMYRRGTHQLVATDGCPVENADANRVVGAVRAIMARHGMEPYNEDTGAGFVRHVVVRVGHESGEMLVTVVTNGREFPGAKGFCRELVSACPRVTTVVQNVNTRATNAILGDEEHTLYGPGFILDTLCGLSFRISSRSFYQVNAVQTEVLYETAVQAAGLTGSETVIDAYCGTGTIGLVAASRGAAHVVGVETVRSAVEDARQNARHNGIANAEFVCADAGEFMLGLAGGAGARAGSGAGAGAGASKAGAFQPKAGAQRAFPHDGLPIDSGNAVLMLDPPRSGCSEDFVRAACALAPSRVVYISCNPETQVRDIRLFAQAGYRVRSVQPVDMFPHTPHVETVVLLSRA